MKHSLRVSDDETYFLVKTEGSGDVEGIVNFLIDITHHPAWRPGKLILLDHRDLRIDGITEEGRREVSDYFISIKDKLGAGKIALVMGREVDFGIARGWEIITEDDVTIQIKVLRDIDEAKAWLGIQ